MIGCTAEAEAAPSPPIELECGSVEGGKGSKADRQHAKMKMTKKKEEEVGER